MTTFRPNALSVSRRRLLGGGSVGADPTLTQQGKGILVVGGIIAGATLLWWLYEQQIRHS